jgi:eukaryotic-like serine/threonine-protein kinase
MTQSPTDRPPLTPDAAANDELATLSGGPEQQTGSPVPGSPELRPAFGPGERVANRYVVHRFIARGGMGEVYEAEDLQLHESVALKTVRPEVAADERAVERFKREIQLARKVTHPNVCRIFDLGVHHGGAGDVLFLTMELLRGATLSAHLKQGGRMSPEQALPLVRQIAEALSAAHRAGVVHRDFKSSNVLLVPEGSGLRAVVTDFGLARSASGQESLHGARGLLGTPAYMAPEQVRGEEATPATDLYAFGMVLYEMLTGKLPFDGDLQAMLYRRLVEDPASPRSVVSDLDARWEKTILRCLERDPADRFQSVSDAIRSLEGVEVAPGSGARRQARRRRLFASLATALVLAAGTAFFVARSGRPPDPAPAPAEAPAAARRSVAILGLKNLSGRPESAWLSTALAELLGTEIAAGDQLRLIPGENVARTRIELGLPDADSYSKETLDRIRQNLGPDLVVLGSYLALGPAADGRLRLDLRLQDTRAGETLATVSQTGTEQDLLDLVTRTGAELRGKLGLPALSAADTQSLQAARPANADVARLYAKGLERLRLFDALSARDLLQKAVAAEPDNPLLHAALAEAWSRLGYDEKVRDSARKAFELSKDLPRRDRLAVEARYDEAARDWPKAVRTYQALFDFYPDNLDYGLRLASAQIGAGRAHEALSTVEALRRLGAPARDDPRIDLAEAQAAGALSDLARQVEAADRAAEKGRQQGAGLLVAEARLAAWWALVRVAKPEEARQACEEARRLFAEAGDRGGEARALASLAYVLRFFDLDRPQARKLYEESLTVSRAIGDEQAVANALRGLGLAIRESRRPDEPPSDEPLKKFEEALALFQKIGNRSGMAWATTSIGYELVGAGKFEEAERKFLEALEAFRELGEKDGAGNVLMWLGELYQGRGEMERARGRFEEMLVTSRESGNRKGIGEALCGIAGALLDEGRLAEASEKLHEALGFFGQTSEAKGIAVAMEQLGKVQLLKGDIEGAKAKFDKAETILHGAGFEKEALLSRTGLGWAALVQGDPAEARRRFDAVLGQEKELPGEMSVVDAHTGLLLLDLGEGDPAKVEAEIRKILAQPPGRFPPMLEGPMHGALALALFQQGRQEEARAEAAKSQALSAKSESLWIRFVGAVVSARVAGPSSELDAARRGLEQALEESTQAGAVTTQMEVRLALGELDLKSGAAEAGRTRLEELEREARAKGFGSVAERAAKALKPA